MQAGRNTRYRGLGTWYFGLPASSSHTLIGAIIGIGLTNALMTGTSVVDALNLPKVLGIFGSLIILSSHALLASGGYAHVFSCCSSSDAG